jgi:hypothetical protein
MIFSNFTLNLSEFFKKNTNMKQAKLLFLLFIFPFFLLAQISEESRSMIKGMNNALVLELPDADERLVKKWWASYMKDYDAKPKRVKGGDELLSASADILAIGGSDGVDIYSRLDQIGAMTVNTVWFDLGEEIGYLSSSIDGDKYVEAEKFLMRFALFVTKEKIKLELIEEEKEMKQLNNDLSKLEREKTSYEREIEQAKERIKRAEANIVSNLESQDKAKGDIDNQKEVIEEVKKRLSEM